MGVPVRTLVREGKGDVSVLGDDVSVLGDDVGVSGGVVVVLEGGGDTGGLGGDAGVLREGVYRHAYRHACIACWVHPRAEATSDLSNTPSTSSGPPRVQASHECRRDNNMTRFPTYG